MLINEAGHDCSNAKHVKKTPKIDLLLIPVYIKFTALVHTANQPTQYVWQFDCCELFRYALDIGLADKIHKAANSNYALGSEIFIQQTADALGRRVTAIKAD